MVRILSALALAAALSAPALSGLVPAAQAQQADPKAAPGVPATYRPAVTVEASTVLLGDIFLGVERDADKVIATAPYPGEHVVLDHAWLARVARAHGVNWQPASRMDRVALSRASQILDRQTIEALVQDALARDGLAGDYAIDFDLRTPEIHLPVDARDLARLQQFQFDRRTLRFAAVLITPANHPESKRFSLVGRAFEQMTLPALARRVNPGEMVEERDLTWIKVRSDQVAANALTDATLILGQSPRRQLQANRMLTANDLETPILVKRNSIVTVVFRHPGMELTGQGKATANASLGEAVRVVNSTSNKQFDAVVTGRGSVAVGAAPRARVAQN